MAKVRASSSIRPRVLGSTLTRVERDFRKRYDQWQQAYSGLRRRLPDTHRDRFDQLGRTLWRFDLRHRWAVGVTALELDDEIITKATTAATKQGYFLLMRLVDLWFSLDLAFALYAANCIPSRVENPSLLESLRRDSERRLRAIKAAAVAINKDLKQRFRKKKARERLAAWVKNLADGAEAGKTTTLSREASELIAARRPMAAEHVASITCLVRNYYVHGGETATSRGLPAQEKVPVLKLFVGFTSISALAMAGAAVGEMLGKPAQFARFGEADSETR